MKDSPFWTVQNSENLRSEKVNSITFEGKIYTKAPHTVVVHAAARKMVLSLYRIHALI
jgi:hypothetical protein